MNCSTCGYEVGGFCTIHKNTIIGGCPDYIGKDELTNFDANNSNINVSFDANAKITDSCLELQNGVFDEVFEKREYKRADLERSLAELEQYRNIGTLEEVREAVEKTKAKKPIAKGINYPRYHCPVCKNFIGWGTVGNYCIECGQKIDRSEEESEE